VIVSASSRWAIRTRTDLLSSESTLFIDKL